MLEAIVAQIPDDTYFFPPFFLAFGSLYLLAYHAVFRDWIPKHRPEASSCFISLAHGTPSAALAALAVLAQPDHRGFASSNTAFQNLVLDYSTAYFVVDLLHYLVFFPEDFLFIAHHLGTFFVFATCRYLALHGAFALLVLLFLAEVTSFCQNVWTLAAMRKGDSSVAARVYASLSPPFYAFYSVTRGLAGPLFFYRMSTFYLRGDAIGIISWWVSFSWIVVVGVAISVSILWVVNHWVELYRERMGSLQEEKKSL